MKIFPGLVLSLFLIVAGPVFAAPVFQADHDGLEVHLVTIDHYAQLDAFVLSLDNAAMSWNSNGIGTIEQVKPVPLAGSLPYMLTALGLGLLFIMRRRRPKS